MLHRTNHVRFAIVAALLIIISPVGALAEQLIGVDAYTSAIGTIHRDTAEWNQIGATGAVITGMTFDTNHNVLYGISPNSDMLYEIDPDTGAASPIGMPGDLGYDNANGLAYDPINDVIYGTDNNTNDLFTVDPRTGVATQIAQINGGFSEIEGLGFDPINGILYGITQLQSRIVSIDTRDGRAAAVSDVLPSAVWRGLEWDPEYNLLYASAVNIFESASIYNYNPENNRLDFRGYTDGVEGIQGLAFIPEPASLLLCLVAIPMIARRRA